MSQIEMFPMKQRWTVERRIDRGGGMKVNSEIERKEVLPSLMSIEGSIIV